jgi:hypothetical protein
MSGFESKVVQIISHDGRLIGLDAYGQVYQFNFGKFVNAKNRYTQKSITIGRENVGWEKLDNYDEVPAEHDLCVE